MTEKVNIDKILADFERNKGAYDAFVRKIEHLVSELIGNAGYNPHTVTSRIKERASLHKKLQKEESSYKSLDDITDIAGVRVTTYFHDDVDRIADVLSKEFEILPEYSVDKRKALDPDQFGYLSLHYVVRLSAPRRALPEYRRFENFRCEIQIRSILQHAWAEIEHDLGYKAEVEVPKDIRRHFSRLAGLLELADQEFVRIRESLDKYQEVLPEAIQQRPSEVFLDKQSLTQFLNTNPIALSLDQFIISLFEAKEFKSGDAQRDIKMLEFVGISTIKDLDTKLRANQEQIKKFATEWIKTKDPKKLVPQGISLFYLFYVLLAKLGDKGKIESALARFSIGKIEERPTLIDRILQTISAIQKA
jgi:ppGpp synthetase/RelA/SpoT-type nucleotidyltranferase